MRGPFATLVITTLIAASQLGCGPTTASGNGGETAGLATAPTGDLPALLQTQYGAMQAGDANTFASIYIQDAFVYGPVASQTIVGRDAAAREIAGLMRAYGIGRPGVEVVIQPEGIRQGGTEDGSCAWSYDQMHVQRGAGQGHFRVVTLAQRGENGWEVVAQSWTVPVPEDSAEAPIAGGWAAPPAMTEYAEPGTEAIRPQVMAFLQGSPNTSWSGRQDTFRLGPTVHSVAIGDDAANAHVQAMISSGGIQAAGGGVYARLACNGQAAYAAYTAVLRTNAGGEMQELPVRGLNFYVSDGAGGFRPVLTQLALGLRI